MDKIFVPFRFEFAIGETFAPLPFLWQSETSPGVYIPVNLTGYAASFTANTSAESGETPLIQATTENGMIVIDGPSGSIQLVLPSSYTGGLSPFEGLWDLWVFSPTVPSVNTRLYGGEIFVYWGVGSP